eukprot:767474-Hanusia_phi.AAC.7
MLSEIGRRREADLNEGIELEAVGEENDSLTPTGLASRDFVPQNRTKRLSASLSKFSLYLQDRQRLSSEHTFIHDRRARTQDNVTRKCHIICDLDLQLDIRSILSQAMRNAPHRQVQGLQMISICAQVLWMDFFASRQSHRS